MSETSLVSAVCRRRINGIIRFICFVMCGYLFSIQISKIQYFGSSDLFVDLPPVEARMRAAAQSSLSKPPSFVVDILSVGSIHRMDYLEAQRDTFATHISVRNFFNATEQDDADPSCSTSLTKIAIWKIVTFCRITKKWDRRRQFVMTHEQNSFATKRWLERKANPQGWLCAQSRPAQGFYKVMQHYKSTGEAFPDYLIIMDDDTYYNIELFQQHFQNSAEYQNSSDPAAIAGCLVRSPVGIINFTIPFGGFGFILNRGALSALDKPIFCSQDRDICHAIQEKNQLNERPLFQEGMTVTDLIYKYATDQPYRKWRNWTTGFCLHSDWYVFFSDSFPISVCLYMFSHYTRTGFGDTLQTFTTFPAMFVILSIPMSPILAWRPT